MVNERHNGNLLVHLGPKLQACPEELLRQRRGHDGQPEYLIQWSIVSLEERAAGGSSASSAETKLENISMWMSVEEVCASCPTLLGKRKLEGQWGKEEKAAGPLAADVPLDEASLLEMKADVRSLVQRAGRQMAESGAPESSILNTIHVLSAYASIGSLAGAFRETGALDLLMNLLCHKEKQIRRSAGKMLRALASHNAGSQAYVLLSLSQQDDIEQHMDFDSCYTLLELFAEMMSSEEQCVSFEGIHLPQISGKLLFILVKRYLCVTSLLEKLSNGVEQGGEQQDCSMPSPLTKERSRMKQEFEFSMAMANLILELVHVMGWDHSHKPESLPQQELQPHSTRSIFQHRATSCSAAEISVLASNHGPHKRQSRAFLTASDFADHSGYTGYLQANLLRGMRVRLLEDCGDIRAGEEGEFLQGANSMHTVQVLWQSTSQTSWVHWHVLEIIGFGDKWEDLAAQEKEYSLIESFNLDTAAQPFFCKPFGRLYSVPYLGESLPCLGEQPSNLSRAEWWELLFFVKKLEAQEQEEIISLIQQEQGEQLSEVDEEALIQLSVPTKLAQKVLQVLEKRCQGSVQRDLQSSHIYIKYFPHCGTEQDGSGSTTVSLEGAGCRSTGPEVVPAKAAKEDLSTATVLPQAPAEVLKSDSQLFSELLEREGLFFPEVTEEQMKALGISTGLSERGSLAKIAAVVDVIQSSSSELGLRLAGLKHILKVLEEEPESEQQFGKSQGRLGTRSVGEKLVKMTVELLSTEVSEKALVVVTLRLLAVLLAKRNWRVSFATEGGVRAVLACMQQHAASALVQQAGLAALRVLVGAVSSEPGGASGKGLPLSHGDAQMMREIFASIGSASSEGSASLLSAIPAAMSTMQRVPGGSSGVRNGLLVVNMLIDGHRGLAEQLVSCDLPAVLQSCWGNGQITSCAHAMLALSAMNRLTEHQLPLGPEMAGREAPLDLRELQVLLGSLEDDTLSKDMVVALERQLCGEGPVPSGEAACLLQDQKCFRLLLRSLELLGAEKAMSLSILRILNKFLDSYQEDVLPWHECVEPCLSSLSAHSSDREVVQEVVGFLHRLGTSSKDCAVGMCRVGACEALSKTLEKHSTAPSLAPALLDLVTDCEKFASLHKKLTTGILAGCIQLVLGQIEEHRRSHRPISIPFFDVFLRSLCRGSSVEVKEDKCWEKVQVSSNPHRASKLTDRNPKTYWESNGSTGSHFITVHMQRGVVVREMSMLVASEDSSYMPARVVVLGGDSPATIRTELNAVTVLPSDSRVILLENMTRFWPVIQIRVKRCQQGGIDTRVRGIEVLGPKPTFWPIFKEQLCRRTFLSCTARAHAWCQEICRDRRRLLQLFDRLNRALRHEQVFADSFLPDEEAARALGRTCWEALVNPLVQSITSPDALGVSPLTWLLSEYLGSVEPPGHMVSHSAVFGSRVRRLTQLLVHMDPSVPEMEEARGAGEKEGKNKEVPAKAAKASVEKASSLRGISQCWRGVVQQQVQRFLEVAGRAPDLVERYCELYQRLRGATEELFGQRAAFVLALGQGFAGALLQLPFLTTLHVSEQFARYLDGQIQELHKAVGSAGPPRRLQQILEPFVIFSGLELTHTFEHFYRHYLGDRLLAQGSSWLEGAVMEQIGLCFPSRFPQEMLSNLAESEELQQQFYLFQLQEQDRRLLELDTGLDKALGSASLADMPEVKVLALSPRCWPVSPFCYMDEPGRFFPDALTSPLDEFANFCRHRQRQLGWECTKPRRLQWTWLGHAELQFGDCILHVSTLQMYILLCFNSTQEVAVEALLQATGLPADLVHHALAPLTHSEGVLLQSCAPGAPGVLRLNQAALARASGRHLRLLPRQRYLRVERAEASALERKRNILCCLITRILKVEKQLHIDNLVFRVIDACQKGELGPGLRFLSFCCHSVDVLSCILHLLNQGYLQRQEERPHVLEYVSAEPTPPVGGQAQMVFQSRLPEATPDEDSVDCLYRLNPGIGRSEEFLMAMLQVPMGHTLSPEEAKLLMNQTVRQVQDTLSVPNDVARHLLMHCRWNVDFLIQCYMENCETLLISSGLQVQDSQPPPSPGTHCPVCVNQLCPTEKPPTLCCMHYCCKPCWSEYLTTRIEQNMIVNCTCPISECRAQPTAAFICSIVSSEEIIAKYEKALLRGYVECCSNLTWCTNPQGCDQILLKDGLGYGAACSKCSWISCFNCSFPEAHYPASCSHMSQWVDDDGYYEGMTSEAQSKHLAKLISKHCPSCQAQIEKNEGCLHMTCAKCNHGFCWRCLKPWRPTHKDYYNCSAMVSKAAWQEKRFQDYNERCTFHHRAREFAVSLRNRVSSISEMPKIRTLTFVLDACKVLEQARKVLAYSCVYSYYNQDTESMDIVEQQTESLELHTNALQIILEETLLQYQDLASSLQLLKAEHFSAGLELVHQIKERLFAILWHSTQDFRVGLQTLADPGQRKAKSSNVPTAATACTETKRSVLCDSPNTDEGGKEAEDEEYEPQWQEDYDDDEDLDEDNFLFDDESDDNLDCDSYFDDDDAYD
ncbi:cullin-9 [Cuculus canorus]|uniref:cullin-9 n=1 Tax=Cuculus canorus TaxID=55661 RepID=UPI0023AA84C7|nr:cullin-9 [Cuculus canorus]XP_053917687.1 cullin-9 [Cuculus canorus]XP_053917688.1 cullin-9 [Cuculus canorus]